MIYLDNAATAKPDKEALEYASKYLYSQFYNPSALYAEGYNLQLEIKRAKEILLSDIADSEDYRLIFTSSGTEADNHAVFCGGKRGNIVISAGEHSAVYVAANEQKQRGLEVRTAPLNSDGSVNFEGLLSLTDEKTSLVSVMHVNNETGAVNDISALSAAVKKKNPYTLFHSDGVQAFGKIPFRLNGNIDMYSISAHKIGGIKGCGALIVRKRLNIKPYIFGGGQEQGLRSGTENVFGIMCFVRAATEKYKNIVQNYEYVSELKEIFIAGLNKELFTVIDGKNMSPYIISLIADGVRGETVLHEADDRGLIIGTGSACSSNAKKRYSRVILSCGISEDRADGVLRVSFSTENTPEEVKQAADILNTVVKNRRDIMS